MGSRALKNIAYSISDILLQRLSYDLNWLMFDASWGEGSLVALRILLEFETPGYCVTNSHLLLYGQGVCWNGEWVLCEACRMPSHRNQTQCWRKSTRSSWWLNSKSYTNHAVFFRLRETYMRREKKEKQISFEWSSVCVSSCCSRYSDSHDI